MKAISLLFLLVSCAHDPVMNDPIKGPLKERNESFRACYHQSEQYGGRFSKPKGEMTLQFRLTKEGKVEDEKIIQNTFPKDVSFTSCVLNQLRLVPFGDQDQSRIVEHKLDFLQAE